ncbi:Ca-activated chloride channel family protein [Prosthecobacter fusiformis]|uniref:Ca-activated chloride channel family protein n=1 Tax=Prosthecobacter fusiformis TaxID=48464 RepID=A0A4R7RP87_9BACT|nr:VWA domain-containing protein [Prosthecobacter fusiformis]TDU67271.1 Ca-activated chloride channel family protein [Prosthecobacter fusiformis]
MTRMTFANPDLLYFLLVLPVLAGLRLWSAMSAGQIVEKMTAPRLRHDLVVGVSSWRAGLIFGLQLAALGFFILAIAQPRWGEDKVIQVESGRNVILALDTSRSMLANDVAPDRMTRARLAAQDVLASLKTDRVGLIAFAGNAYLQAPLTTDHEAVVEAIQSLDFTSVPRGGSDLGKALKLAMDTFEKNPARNHGLILFSDGGEPNEQVREYALQAAKKNILVLTVGVGTEAGSLIPDPDPDRVGDYVRDRSGNVVKTTLQGGVLQEIATATRGRYLKLGSQPLAVSVVRDLLSALQAQTNEAKQLVKPLERFQWPLSIGVLLLMIAWSLRSSSPRRLAPVMALVFLGLGDVSATASDGPLLAAWGSVFERKKVTPEEAEEALKDGDHKRAADLFGKLIKEDPPESVRYRYAQALGYASHQSEDYDRAIGAFSKALESEETTVQKQAHQGLAHSLYDQGDRTLAKQPKFTLKTWRDSLKHFDAALKQDPENEPLKENREFVKKRLDELQKQIDQQEQKGDKGDKGDKKKGEKGEEGEEGEEGEDGEQDGKGKNDKDRSRKESLGKKKGEEKEEELPEGELQAANKGEPKEEEGEQAQEAEGSENETDDATGFSPNEARAFLRTYADDQKKAQIVRPRDPAANGKDW